MDVKLVMFKQDGERKDFPVRQGKTVLGRGTDCGLRVPLLDVSRQHCELVVGDDEIRVRDLASSNGTYVNSKRVSEAAVKAGDRLTLGPIIFTVQVDGKPEAIARQAAPAGKPAAGEDEIVELEADFGESGEVVDLAGAEESDPISALEALAQQGKKDARKGKKG